MTTQLKLSRVPAGMTLAAHISGLLRDSLVRNSFFLMLTTALAAGSGFVFWIIVARFFSTVEVGQASSLLSSVALLSYFSLFGFSSALVRYLPTSSRPSEDSSTAVTSVALCSVVLSGIFVAIAPWLAQDLGFIRSSLAHTTIFLLLAVGAAINLLTDSIFVAYRDAKCNLLINGLLMSLVKLGLPALFIAYGAFGIFAANGVASVVAALVSLVAVRRHLRLRLRLEVVKSSLRSMLRYSMSSYVSGALNLIPQIALPILVLRELGPVMAAVYFISFQVANLVNAGSYSIGEALFAEGSHESRGLRALAIRSGGLMLFTTLSAVAVVVITARPVLRVFGEDYARHGTSTLIVFTVSSIAVAFNTWTSFLLKITRQLAAMVVSNVALVTVILGVALYEIHAGLVWAALAWGAGNFISGAIGAVALAWKAKRRARDEIRTATV